MSKLKNVLLNKKRYAGLLHNPKVIIGGGILFVFVFLALFGQWIFPYSTSTDFSNRYAPASAEHWLGTDDMGRDVFRQLVNGCRTCVGIAVLTAAFTTFLGVFIGVLSAYCGGIADKAIQVVTNLFLNVPSFPILLLLSTLITIEDNFTFALVLSIFNWAGLSRSVRAQVISLKERDFIQICKVINMSRMHIIFRELMPNISSYILINFILQMKNAIFGCVGIMTLGLAGFDPSNWGAMLFRAKSAGLINPKVMNFLMKPLVTVCLFQTGATLLAHGLDEFFNPRLQRN